MGIDQGGAAARKGNSFVAWGFALLVVVVAGLTNLRKPFAGDQALFVIGARAISHGAVLYRDFWDLKQPGIYWFYLLGIQFPGSTEVAVHLWELLYFTIFSGVIIVSLRRYFHQPTTAAIAGALSGSVYFIICGGWHLTQVEGLAAFPLFVCAWLLLNPETAVPLSMRRIFLAGIAAGVVIVFKLALVLLPVGFVMLLIVHEFFYQRRLYHSLLGILIFNLGILLVVSPILFWWQSNEQLGLLYRTFIEYPIRISRELPHNKLDVYVAGVRWFLTFEGPLLPLAAVGAWARRKDLFGRGMVLWFFGGLALIALQRMGWAYHFLLVLCPITILAAAGIEFAFLKSSRNRRIIALPVVVLLPYLGMFAVKAVGQLHDQRAHWYENHAKNTAFLYDPKSRPGPIYALGDPLTYYVSGRSQAVAINGSSPEWFLGNQWRDLAMQLRVARPVYIFIGSEDSDLLSTRGQAVISVLNDDYREISQGSLGAWYVIRKR